jgi:pimeloyl-ACP methyl ester carboxylesterase
MRNARFYGKAPFGVAILHGGPGAPGEVAPVARELSRDIGVIEPMQKADSIDGQVEELRSLLNKRARLPVDLVGHSWGAWLGFIFTARHPGLVRKLVMIGSGPFEQRYAARISETRRGRMDEDDRSEMSSVLKHLEHPAARESEGLLRRLGELSGKTD